MKDIRCVLFDFDGTLFDTSEGIKMCYRKGLEQFGVYVKNDSELDRIIGPSLFDSYRSFYGLVGDDVVTAVRIYREHYNSNGIYMVHPYDGIEKALIALKENSFTLGVATSKPKVMAEKILDFTGMAKYFDVVCGANLDGTMSDKVELITEAMKLSGFTDKTQVCMVGDRFYDIAGAKKVGICSVGVTYGFGGYDELVNAGADYIADSPMQAARLIIG